MRYPVLTCAVFRLLSTLLFMAAGFGFAKGWYLATVAFAVGGVGATHLGERAFEQIRPD